MNDSSGQFIAVCPKCSAILRVNVNKLGHNVRCSQCHHTFVGGEALESPAQPPAPAPVSAPPPTVPLSPISEQVERIDAVCPGCKATLHVRRVYIGNDVRCKYCEKVFRVQDPAEHQAQATHEHVGPGEKQLQAEHEQLYVAHNLLQADHERLKSECDELRDNFRRVTAELDTIRLALGSIAPEEVGELAGDRQSLSEEVHRLRDEVHTLIADRAERDRLVAERLQWESELHLSRTERDRLVDQLRERDDELAGLCAEIERLRDGVQAGEANGEGPTLNVFSEHTPPDADRSTRTADLASNVPEASETELEELRAQLADANLRLEHAEDRNREMSAMLRGVGIRWEPTWA
jgi:predicted Zn finger-like uncharacterized protein